MAEGGSTGRSFVEAATHKYIESMDEECEVKVYVPKRGPAKLSESGDLILPRLLHLTSCDIHTAGESSEIHSMCVNVCELDLTQNRFSQWAEVVKLVKEIPHLSFLNLTANPLHESHVPVDMQITFPHIQQLVLNHTRVGWGTIEKLLTIFPSLSELHLSLNGYSSIDISPSIVYPSLTKLHFNANQVSQWEQVRKLGHIFPNMETLVLTECKLSTFGSESEICAAFPKLSSLNVNKTQIDSWEEVDKFKLFPALKDVRLVSIPFFESMEQKLRRQLIVARTPTILMLNGSHVREQEREDAERAFIRHYQHNDEKPQRYNDLEAKYGKLDPLVEVDLVPQTTFKMKVVFEDDESESTRSEEMEVCTNQTVAQLKKLLSNFVGAAPAKWRLYYWDKTIVTGPDLMRFPSKMLYTYNLTDGDEFICHMK